MRRIIAQQLSVPLDVVASTSLLVEDFGADGLAFTQLALALDEEFDIEVIDEELVKLATVADVVAYVRALTDAEGTSEPPSGSFSQ